MKLSKSTLWSILALVVVIIAVVLIIVLVPNNNKNNGSNNSLSSSQKTADTQAATANFKKFFTISTSMSERQSLLQNGAQFAQSMNAEFAQLNNESPSVSINQSSLTNSTTVKVTYTIDLNGQPVLSNQSGEVLKINGVWKVSDATLCTLLSLGGSAPAACNNAH
ncbi:MAG: hypothetical protein ACREF7_02425 [Candidatus Saccharimonadales bacterium]